MPRLTATPLVSRVATQVAATSRRPPTLGSSPEGTVSLAMGEPFGGTPPSVVAAATEALRRGRTKYAPLAGDPDLRARVADHLSGRYDGARVSASNVVLTHGASGGLAAAVLALVDPGDKVVLPEPTYSLYADHAAMAGASVEWVPNTWDGRLDLDQLEHALEGAKLVIVCNPGNPTGRITPPEDIAALAAIAERRGVWVLVDEAYRDIVFDGVPFTSALSLLPTYANVLCCGTFSKSYAMTGWRLGWVVGHEEPAAAVNLVHRSFNGALNTFVQDAAAAALELPAEHFTSLVDEFQARRDLVVQALADVEGVSIAAPQGAFYAFPRVEGLDDSRALTARLATRGVLVRSGWEYGPSGEGHLRLSFATDIDSLQRGLDRLSECLRQV